MKRDAVVQRNTFMVRNPVTQHSPPMTNTFLLLLLLLSQRSFGQRAELGCLRTVNTTAFTSGQSSIVQIPTAQQQPATYKERGRKNIQGL